MAALAAIALVVAWGLGGPGGVTGRAYDEAVAAAEVGDWATAFRGFRQVTAIDPTFRNAAEQVGMAAGHLLGEGAEGLSVEVEVDLLRWLVDQGDLARLAAVLDHSMVDVPAGWGTMGSNDGPPNEQPARTVYLDEFTIDRYEVTNAQYDRYLRHSGEPAPVYWTAGTYPAGHSDHPVLGVSWRQANDYCGWAGKRLPTEAEWERACRGPAGFTYPWGDTWDPTLANTAVYPIPDLDDLWPLLTQGLPAGDASPQPVGSHPDGASPYGVLDLCGNASEWVADWYDPTAYTQLPVENPIGEEPPWNHSVRGSAWLTPHQAEGHLADISRCGFRNASHSYDDPRVGFRCAASESNPADR